MSESDTIDSENVESLWKEFDESELDKLDLAKRSLCFRLQNLVDDSKKSDIEKELLFLNFAFGIKGTFMHKEFDKEWYNENVRLFREQCTNDILEYYKERLDNTPSFLNKAHYSLACWLTTYEPDYLSKFVLNMIESIIILGNERKYSEIFRRIMLICNIGRFYRLKDFNNMFNDTLLKIIYDTDNTKDARWMLEPIWVLSVINEEMDYELINKLFTIIHRNAHNMRNLNKSHLERSLLEESLHLCKFMSLSSEEKEKLRKEIHYMIGQSHERTADQYNENGTDGMVSVYGYRDAQLEYQRAEAHTKIQELNEKIRESSKRIEWKEISHSFTMEPLKLEGINGHELVNSISNHSENIPKKENVEDLTKNIMKDFPISGLFNSVSFNEKGPTSFSNDEESNFNSRLKQQTIFHIQLAEARLSLAVTELERDGKISANDFMDFLKGIGLHDDNQAGIIKSGIENHFRGDFIASVSTLIPMVEGTLRSLLNSRGIFILRNKEDQILDSELGPMLHDERTPELIGEDLINYIQIKYADPDGINQRNKVSHALNPMVDFNHKSSISLIQVICKLAKMSVITKLR